MAELLTERAPAAGVQLAAVDEQDVAEICRRVEDIPLAIELAAARHIRRSNVEHEAHGPTEPLANPGPDLPGSTNGDDVAPIADLPGDVRSWYAREGWGMDPITLIVTALAAGAALGVKDTASSAVRDAYASLKALVQKRFAGRPAGELVLAEHESAPGTWDKPLAAQLGEVGADRDADVVAAAQELMRLVDEAGSRAGKYTVDVRGAQGVQVGDHSTQHNVFGAPPRSSDDQT